MNVDEVQQLITAKVPVAGFLGLEVESVEEGHVRLRLPFAHPVENHLGIVYAGAIFSLAEIAGGVVMLSAFDTREITLIIRRLEIDFVRPSRRDLFCDVQLSAALVDEARASIAGQGTADVSLPIEVTDARGRAIARARANYYLRLV